ncbi:hypothetical protein ACLOJK_004420 [Asimina triloba]
MQKASHGTGAVCAGWVKDEDPIGKVNGILPAKVWVKDADDPYMMSGPKGRLSFKNTLPEIPLLTRIGLLLGVLDAVEFGDHLTVVGVLHSETLMGHCTLICLVIAGISAQITDALPAFNRDEDAIAVLDEMIFNPSGIGSAIPTEIITVRLIVQPIA